MQACLTLGDVLIPRKTLLSDILLVLGASLFMALMARIALPLPFSPVPVTGQTFAVLLVGAVLGSRLGTLGVLAYIAEGAAGDLLKLALAMAALPLAWKVLRRES